MKPRYDTTLVEHLEATIDQWQPPPKGGLSAREVVERLWPKLEQKKANGWRLADLAAELQKVGIDIAPSTLGAYLSVLRSAPPERLLTTRVLAEFPLASPASSSEALGPSAVAPSSPLTPSAAHIARLNEDV